MLDQYKDVLTINDIQEILGVGRTKAYNLIQSKKIPTIQLGKSIRVSKVHMINYINSICDEETNPSK